MNRAARSPGLRSIGHRLSDAGLVRAAFFVAVFLVVVGSRLWLIDLDGSDVPFWDQWNGEGSLVYKPLLEHGIRAVDWFAPHNEHRIFTTRVTDAALLFVNGQWDPLVQMCWNAGCAALIAVLLCVFCTKIIADERYSAVACCLVVVGSSLPFAWENTLAGFQTQFFYLILLALALFATCGRTGAASGRRLVVVGLVAALSLLTLAAGTLTCVAALSAAIVRTAIVRGSRGRRNSALIGILLAAAVIGLATTPTIERHAVLRAPNLLAAWQSFNHTMGWPSSWGILIWIPAVAWLARLLAARRVSRPDFVLLALAAFVVVNAAAIAYARGSDPTTVASRYTDVVWLGWLVNALALLSLMQSALRPGMRRRLAVAALAYVVSAAYVLVVAGMAQLTGAEGRRAMYAVETSNVRTYVVEHDPAALAGKATLDLPFPQPDLLRGYLDDPTIRDILPPGIRPGIVERSMRSDADRVAAGLVLTGVPYGSPPAPAPVGGYFWGTWGKEGAAHLTHFISPPMRARGTRVRLRVSGYLGHPGMALYLESVLGGRRVDLTPGSVPGQAWVDVQADIPGRIFRIVAIDDATSANGWFAFTDPVEIGRLRPWAERALRRGRACALLGGLMFLVLAMTRPRQINRTATSRPA